MTLEDVIKSHPILEYTILDIGNEIKDVQNKQVDNENTNRLQQAIKELKGNVN